MIDVTIATYEQDIIEASVATPVLVDFWAPWCTPCKTLGPVLDKLDAEYAGRFILAKVNIDESPQLAAMFGVRSVPTGISQMFRTFEFGRRTRQASATIAAGLE